MDITFKLFSTFLAFDELFEKYHGNIKKKNIFELFAGRVAH